VVEGYVHISWTGDVNDGFDIGLLKLDRESNATLPAIDTHHTPLSSGDLLTALGWGSTDTQEIATVLQITENLLFILPVRCKEVLDSEFRSHMICAGMLNEDTCKGDSGGPILIPDRPQGNLTAGHAQTDLIVGVTSFGSEACDGSSPGVYIKISNFWTWILGVIDGQTSQTESSTDPNATEPLEEAVPPTETPAETEASATAAGIEDRNNDTASEPATSSTSTLGEEDSNNDTVSEPATSSSATIGDEELISIIEADSAGILEDILSGGLDPNSRRNDPSIPWGNYDDTPLHWAARFDSVACAKVLIDFGAELQTKNNYGASPLHICGADGSIATAQVLLDQGASVHAIADGGSFPIHYACHNGQAEITEFLLRNGADIEATSDRGWTPLIEACIYGNEDVVEVLLRYDANVNAADEDGNTPLHWTSAFGFYTIATALVEAGASTTPFNNNGYTPLDFLCAQEEANCSEVTKRLMTELLSP